MRKYQIAAIFLLFLSAVLFYLNKDRFMSLFFKPRNSSIPITNQISEPETKNIKEFEVIAKDLVIPWEIAFLDKDTFLVTERPGNLLMIKMDGDKTLVKKIEGVAHQGEGGLLGLALHPKFSENHYVYLYSTYSESGLLNRVERYKFEDEKLSDRTVILDKIEGSSNHDGGRIAFGPDGYLYITIGDAESPNNAQDKNSLNGKILRIKDGGTVPSDNPFGNEVYSYGHRNPQGLTWDDKGQLWATEHGPSGTQTGNDELNLIEKGKNYGWPTIKGTQTQEDMVTPKIESGSNDTWAPGQAVFYKDSIYFVGLRGSALYRAVIKDTKVVELKTYFKNEFGRLRTIVIGPDGQFYISTSNRDGRGTVKEGDDKIIRINPDLLK